MPEQVDLGDEVVPLEAVEQLEADQGVPVRPMGPVQTRELPARPGGMLNTVVQHQQPESLSGTDPRRKRLYVLAVDFDIIVGLSRGEVTGGTGFYLPAGKDLDITHIGQVFAAAANSGEEARVSYLVELWA